MKTMYLAITQRCNHRCIICPHSQKHTAQELSVQQLRERVHRARLVQGVQGVTLSGGEPLLHSDIGEIFSVLQQEGLAATVLTNGVLLADDAVWETVLHTANTKMVSFVVSLHSHIAAVHDDIAGKTGSFAKTVTGIKRLAAAGYTVQVKHCVHKRNYRETAQFAAWFDKTFPVSVRLHLCNIDYCGLQAQTLLLTAVSLRKTGRAVGKALVFFTKQQNGRRVSVSEVPLCTLRRRFWRYGIKTSTFLAYTDSDLNGNATVATDTAKPFSACKRCRQSAVCDGVWQATAQFWRAKR